MRMRRRREEEESEWVAASNGQLGLDGPGRRTWCLRLAVHLDARREVLVPENATHTRTQAGNGFRRRNGST